MSDNESETEEVGDLSSPDVTTKYRSAGDVTQKVLMKVAEACVAGADIGELCEMGDQMIEEETAKSYNKKVKGKKMEKGVAFPTCISVNEIVSNFSPPKGERTLNEGDVVKVEMACHIDGFITGAAHTIIVGTAAVEDRRADCIMAAWNVAEAALRLVQPGNTNTQVTEAIEKITADFGCKPIQGMISHQVKKHVIDGTRTIGFTTTGEEKVEEFEFELNEVYCLDIGVSTGEGKVKETDIRSMVYKRNVEKSYILKTAKSRQFISEVNKRFPSLPFSLKAISDAGVVNIGVSESKRHELIEEFPVYKEKDGECVARFKFTLLLLPGGTKKITGLPLGIMAKQVVSKASVADEDMKKLLATTTNPKKQKQNKKAAAKAKAEKEDDEDEKGE